MSRPRADFGHIHSRQEQRLKEPTVARGRRSKVPGKRNILDNLLLIIFSPGGGCSLKVRLRHVIRDSRLKRAADILHRAITVKRVARLIECALVLYFHVRFSHPV